MRPLKQKLTIKKAKITPLRQKWRQQCDPTGSPENPFLLQGTHVRRIFVEWYALCVPDGVILTNFRSTVCILRAFSDERSRFSVVCISDHAQRISARRSLLTPPFPANGLGFPHANYMSKIIMNPPSYRIYCSLVSQIIRTCQRRVHFGRPGAVRKSLCTIWAQKHQTPHLYVKRS